MYTEAAALVRLHDFHYGYLRDGRRSDRDKAEIERCRKEVDPSILAKYEQLKRRFNETAIVEVNGNTCTGCRMSLPSILLNRVKEGLVFCESCGRLLFSPDIVYRYHY